MQALSRKQTQEKETWLEMCTIPGQDRMGTSTPPSDGPGGGRGSSGDVGDVPDDKSLNDEETELPTGTR